MKRINVAQVGDIHYPEAASSRRLSDWKDASFPKSLGEASSADALTNATRALVRYVDDNRPLLMFCGDLTTFGDLQAYRQCLEFIRRSLRLDDASKWPLDRVHATPGNHDVNRSLANDATGDLYSKFVPLREAWVDLCGPLLADRIRMTTAVEDGVQVELISLNSCIGCGERRFLPPDVQTNLHGLIEQLASIAASTGSGWMYEQLDTPAFDEQAVAEALEAIDRSRKHSIAIFLGHHNLLPQVVPRLEIYSELVNGGQARARMSNSPIPAIYLHGHIHDDPIEMIRQFRPQQGALLSVSAPLFVDGFNVLELQFDDQLQVLGCIVTPYRMQAHGLVSPLPSVRVPMSHSRGSSNEIVRGMTRVMEYGRWYPFPTLRQEMNQLLGKRHQAKKIASAVLEAEWKGWVRVENRDDAAEDWRVERVPS